MFVTRLGRDLGRYLLWQLPGWLLTAALAGVVARLLAIPWWTGVIVAGLVAAKDLALFPVLRETFRPAGDPRPVGARGRVVDDLAPTGQVRVRGELWRATTRDGRTLPGGAPVRVVEAHGLLLVVEADDVGG